MSLLFVASGCSSCSSRRTPAEGDTRSTSVVEPGLMPSESDGASSCGRETNVHGSGYDAAARSCLWDAWRNGSTAGLVITMHTVEGDPITYTLRVRPGPVVDVTEDSRDRFGSPGVTRTSCKSLEKRSGTGDRFGFVLRGCEGRASEIVIP
ncbi:DUF4362 domain-containing protein [Polyangium jinanense]|uniref:Uncharacterized protein n=1 Tax=Polyangium jinanense TaxID=2829994 RepID=A0A9X4AW96_9BACT|nr:DUF4362 domain-containing protein [Polyangium jinanense]MDC3955961.1 hypothetical protein [Polyangium jinanense]MDC3985100.1 hypothetical protein [Polyangium jinanense]